VALPAASSPARPRSGCSTARPAPSRWHRAGTSPANRSRGSWPGGTGRSSPWPPSNAATAIARALQSELRIFEVLNLHWAGTPAIIPGSGAALAAHQPAADARTRLGDLVARLPEDTCVETTLVLGDPVTELTEVSHDADLLVLGSRGYGPHPAVLLGGVSGRLMRRSACPVIVVPRGNQAPLEDLFRAASIAQAMRPTA
jgi:nucleotide-binding universal stress UspA family protein